MRRLVSGSGLCRALLGLVLVGLAAVPMAAAARDARIGGTVEAAGDPLRGYAVTLYRTRPDTGGQAVALGSAVTAANGSFVIGYTSPSLPDSILYLVARKGKVALATALVGSPEPDWLVPTGDAPPPRPRSVVINERSTVAVGFAFAQFVDGTSIAGNRVGVRNAASMVGNMVQASTGFLAPVLRKAPNGTRTSTMATFNTLANLVQTCAVDAAACGPLLAAAPDRAGDPAPQTLQAVANIARNPWRNIGLLYDLATTAPEPYRPSLAAVPPAWTIALTFSGDGTIDGPGAFAIDAEGNAWLGNNYTPGGPFANVCGGRTVFKFLPSGQLVPGAPFAGGGLSGAGFGVILDPKGRLWVGNFGFESPACAADPLKAAKHDSVSLFTADGAALSPRRGFTAGQIFWPQGMASARDGTIWIANCGNDSVTVYPQGDPRRARSIGKDVLGLGKPFDVVVDGKGRAWVVGNDSESVAIVSDTGIRRLTTGFDRPMGIASDSQGNMWVANSGLVNVPCPDGGPVVGDGPLGSVALIRNDGTLAPRGPFTGGGITVPWGVAVDGNDQVWVANFGGGRGNDGPRLVRISQLCGVRTETCPPGLRTGDPISPPGGYASDGLTRTTDVAIDPSGNLWVTNNWKIVPPPSNPGGRSIMIFVGIAGPLKTPVIGPPVAAE